jgi:hypothetical protein
MFEGLLRINAVDKLIAKEVMGWRLCHYGFWETEFGELDSESEWNPSENINDAWIVLEKLRDERNILLDIVTAPSSFRVEAVKLGEGVIHVQIESTAPMAICIAALKAYGVEVAE